MSVCVQMTPCGSECIWISALCVLWPRDIDDHECMFSCTCTDSYIHRCYVCVCVHVSDYRHMCGDVFVQVFFLLECLQEGKLRFVLGTSYTHVHSTL